MAEFKFKIIERKAVIGERTGYKKALNIVSWGEGAPKLDIREWSDDETRMTKGLTFTKDEMIKLRDALNEIDFDIEDVV